MLDRDVIVILGNEVAFNQCVEKSDRRVTSSTPARRKKPKHLRICVSTRRLIHSVLPS
jgi:hypothetical protein